MAQDPPPAGDAGPHQVVCTSSATLNAVYQANGYWSKISGSGTIANTTNNLTSIAGLASNSTTKLLWNWNDGSAQSSEVWITYLGPAGAGLDNTTCSGSYNLTGNIPPSMVQSLWTSSSGQVIFAEASMYNTAVSNLPQGSTTFTWTLTGDACTESSVVTITNNEVTASATDQNLCTNVATLDGNNPSLIGATGYWNVLGGAGVVLISSQYNSIVTGLSPESITLEWTVSKGACTSTSSITLTNNLVTSNAGSDNETCTNTIALAGSLPTPGTGQWNVILGTGTFSDNLSYNSTISGLAPGANTLRWTVTNNGCTASSDVVITNNEVTASATDQNLCTNVATLDGNPPGPGASGYWSKLSGTATITNPTLENTSVINLFLGSNLFSWSLTKGSCTSSSTINVTNNEFTTFAGNDTTICADYFYFNAMAPIPGGTGNWSIINSTGLVTNVDLYNTSVTQLQLGNNVFRWTVTQNSCVSSDEIVVSNNLVTASATNVNVCGNTATLAGNNPSPGFGTWTVQDGTAILANASMYNSVVSNLMVGTNNFMWSINHLGCISDVNATIVQVFAEAGIDSTLCGNSLQMYATNTSPNIGEWSVTSGSATIVSVNDNATWVNNLGIGLNTLKWTVNGDACTVTDLVNITNSTPTAQAGADFNTCSAITNIGASVPANGYGYWTGLGNPVFSNASLNNTTVRLNPNKNFLYWNVNNNGCLGKDTLVIQFDSVSISNAGADLSTCNSYSTLSANNPAMGTGTWSTAVGGVLISNAILANTGIYKLPLGATAFQWTVTNGNCSNVDEVIVNNDSIPMPQAGNQNLCAVDFTQLNATAVPAGGTGGWSIVNGLGSFANPNQNNSNVTAIGLGQNRYRWTVSKGACSSYLDINVNRFSLPFVNAGLDSAICKDSLQLKGNSMNAGALGIWTVNSGSAVFSTPSQSLSWARNLAKGANTFTWTIKENDCVASDNVIITNNSVSALATDMAVCDNSTILMANAPLAGESGKWRVISGTGVILDTTKYSTMVTNLSPGLNTFRWIVTSNSCVAYDNAQILYNGFIGFNEVINGNTVSFNTLPTDSTSNSWYWDFGDGNMATTKNPSNTYAAAGVYKVSLDATKTNGCVASFEKEIKVGTIACMADFTFTVKDSVVTFTDKSVGGMTKWIWNFGDRSLGITQSPVHTYSYGDEFNVCLSVANTANCMDQVCKPVLAGNVSCNSKFSAFIDPVTLNVKFSDQSMGNITSWYWNFGDGETSMLRTPNHVYQKADEYTVSLAVKNSTTGCYDYYEQTMFIGKVTCKADFDLMVDQTSRTVQLSNKSIGSINKIYWNFNDGTFSTQTAPVHIFDRPGRHKIELIIADTVKKCMDHISKDFNLSAGNCNAKFTYFMDPATKTAKFMNEKLAPNTTLFWQFGDGTNFTGENPVHQYIVQRFYDVSLTVINTASGCFDNYTASVLAGNENADCKADFIFQVDPVTRKVAFSDKSIGKISTYEWDFNDGLTATGSKVDHIFATAGVYNVCLNITNTASKSSIVCQPVLVNDNSDKNCLAKFNYVTDLANKNVSYMDNSLGKPTTWAWAFGDAQTASVASPQHTFATNDYFISHLKITNASGCKSDRFEMVNLVSNSGGLRAGFGSVAGQPNGKGKIPVSFSAATSGSKSKVKWNFGDGTKMLSGGTNSSSLNPVHEYDKEGTYNVCLTITDDITGLSDTYCNPVVVTAPVAIYDKIENISVFTCYPNPMKDETQINFNLLENDKIDISVYDFTGKKVAIIFTGNKPAGENSLIWDAEAISSGLYIIKLVTSKGTLTQKLMITK